MLDDQKKTIRIYEQNMALRQFETHMDLRQTYDKNLGLTDEVKETRKRERELHEMLRLKENQLGEMKKILITTGWKGAMPNGPTVKVTIEENLHEVAMWKKEYERLAKNKELLLYENENLHKDDEILRLRS